MLKEYKNFNISRTDKNNIILIGNFDGLHVGHQQLFKLAKIYSNKFKLKIGVLTFDPLPIMFFNKRLSNYRIINNYQKKILFYKAGADFILDSRELSHSEIIDLVLRTTEGVLPASIFDTVGTKKSFDLGIRLLGKAGTYVNVAVHDLNLDVNSMSIASEKTITSSCNFDVIDYEDTLRWLEEGRIKVDDWIHRISLQDVPNIFPRLIQDQKKDIFKVCINF